MAQGKNAPMFDDVGRWFQSFLHPTVLIELGTLAGCTVLAWLVVSGLRRALHGGDSRSILFGRKVLDGVLFPLTLLGLVYLAQAVLLQWIAVAAFKVAIPVLMALVVIRVGVKVLQAAFPQSPWVRPIERTLSWLAWLAMVLWVTGLLPLVLQDLDDIIWKVGGTAMSVRKALSNATRALLLFVGLITALSVVGIDLTALSVLGGAVGVGIGFGLQKLAANYVSGFVILAERSVRIGDNVRVDGFEGRITDITGRYTLIRSGIGRESIVPNEMLITQRVENFSLADPRVWHSTVVSVAYGSDVDLVMRLLSEAALASERVLREPAPSVSLSAFGADGLEFTVGFWIADPENGLLGLRSQINLAILRSLQVHGIDIPYPQSVVHVVGEQPTTPAAWKNAVPQQTPDLPREGTE